MSSAAWARDCPPSGPTQAVLVERVIDGDTLRLADGSRVRLIGVDAPELDHQEGRHEPLAEAASAAVKQFLAGGKAYLVFGEQPRDHYGRTLAYVYNGERESLEALLLRRGLAFHVTVPPNLAQASCFAVIEREARDAQRGVWGEPYWRVRPAAALGAADAGFRRVVGRVTGVSIGRDIWLELDGPLVLRIGADDRERFTLEDWTALVGRRVEVQGWVVDRSDSSAAQRGFKPLLMPLRTPFQWLVLD
ncbi:thermonuclease family protein [Marinimicrobium alkaliphilum]|uniref:thermonuclease family protein n=1 Tax=Marinimicrobium alkaliphilum TaxID=2202654 RepID=UPI0013007A39|nr:thermonuclease family protein [Marinimicrobium alkaliphilum]